MSVLLNAADVKKTWAAVEARIKKRPVFQVVPEAAMVTIENVILANEDEAWDRFPADQKCRVHFWKQCILEAVVDIAAGEEKEPNVGLWAVYFHEYIAASLRGDGAAGVEVDDDTDVIVYSRRSVSPAIAQRALAEAYQTCAAGLDGYRVSWDE
jgi:hypothetical protein